MAEAVDWARWRRQLESSLDHYLRENDAWRKERLEVLLAEDAELAADRFGDDNDGPGSLVTPLYSRIFEAHAQAAAWRRFEAAWERVDPNSPPADVMFLALVLVGGERFDAVYFTDDYWKRAPAHPKDYSYLVIAPELTFGDKRVDFFLRLASLEPFEDAEDMARAAAQTDSDGRVSAELVIEVDGHDFHERTKQQASRDRRRDRELLNRRLPVARFTGSDIYRDPFGCADEALNILQQRVITAGDVPYEFD